MQCPNCGAQVPDGAGFCTACGAQVPAPAPPPAAATPAGAPAPPPVQPPAPPYAPPQQPQYAQPGYAPAGVPAGAPPKKRTGLVIALVILGFLLLCCLVGGIGGFLYWRSLQVEPPALPDSTSAMDDTRLADDSIEIEEAAKVVEAYYAAISAGDLDGAKDQLAASVAEEVTPDWYEGWDPSTAFEYTRGVKDGDTITIYGRESVQAYGSGDDGGVKFTLVVENGSWRITAWAGADRMQVEGADTTGSSTGETGDLSGSSARELVTQLLEARQRGDANRIRQLTTARFQQRYGDIWLDGIDNTEYFLSFEITGVTIDGSTATVTTNEEWNSGPEPAAYTVIEEGGALLVDTWD